MNSFFFFVLGIFIIANKFFLFNEEFLILISFISFCYLIYIKLSPQINLQFENKVVDLQNSFASSLNSILFNLKQKKELNNKLVKFKFIFESLKIYYKSFSNKFLTEFLRYLKLKSKNDLINRLFLFSVIENEYSKFITFLLVEKLNNISNLLTFLNFKIRIKRFQTFSKINKIRLLKKI